MKRIVASIFLLAIALLISKPFAAELDHPSSSAKVTSNYIDSSNSLIGPETSGALLSAGCPCAMPSSNPTITLVLMAAVAAWLSMATFIYGSHFIAALIAG